MASDTRQFFRPVFSALEDSGIGKIFREGFNDPDVIPLWVGEGERPTPASLREPVKAALDEGHTFYNRPVGRIELSEALKAYLDRLYGTDLSIERLVVPGSTMLSLNMAALMTLTTGDRAIVVTPHWPNIVTSINMTGAEIDFVRLESADGRWHLDFDKLVAAIRPETRAIYINSPSNPTGWIMERDEIQAVVELCRQRRIVVLADEVYHRTVYDRDVAPSFLEVAAPDDPVISIGGFSKAWAMTGWRLGWLVAPEGLREQLSSFSVCLNTGAPVFTQFGALAALGPEGETVVDELRSSYAESRDLVRRRLGQHSRIELLEPSGAFYAFPRIEGMHDSLAFCLDLLRKQKVGLAPGYTFGPGSEAHVRLCFARSPDHLDEGLTRFLRYLDS